MSGPPPIRALILDFDGVVVESNGIKTEAFADVFARFPEHSSEMMAFHERHISLSRFEKFAHLARDLLRVEDVTSLVEELGRDFSRRVLHRLGTCDLVPGAREFLTEFSDWVPLYLASITPEPELREILARRDLLKCFRGVYGCPPTPKVAAVREVLAATGFGPEELLLVGDSPGDLAAARETGVNFMARDSGIKFGEPDLPLYPDLVSVAEVVRSRLVPV